MFSAYRLILLVFLGGAALHSSAQNPPPFSPPGSYSLISARVFTGDECTRVADSPGPCASTSNLPALTQRLGTDPGLFFAQTGIDPASVLAPAIFSISDPAHSYFALAGRGSFQRASNGFLITTRDRLGSDYTRIKLHYQFPTSRPVMLGAEARIIPWREDRQTEIAFRFAARITKLEAAEGSAAYGHPTLEFRDIGSGLSLLVTLQTFGTTPPRDFASLHAESGKPIVSTGFRADPGFGRRIEGDYRNCSASGECGNEDRYDFRLARGDFVKILALARELAPALSDDPSHYLLDNAQFNNEVYRDGELAVSLDYCHIQLLGY